ncbi:MAG: hypothetical protein EA343_20325 [Nodularia sp. (in: Bacteria)]|nr:MAG: hypothetical protein EA343_20325 [Nodularia sp. (in: cyanobacteria)]
MSDTFTISAILMKTVKIVTFLNCMRPTKIVLTQRGGFGEDFVYNFFNSKINKKKKLSYSRDYIWLEQLASLIFKQGTDN